VKINEIETQLEATHYSGIHSRFDWQSKAGILFKGQNKLQPK